MALSRAEIQRNYRERKKQQDGDKYLAKERARQKRNYVSVINLSESSRKKRNKNINGRVRKHRAKVKELERREIIASDLAGETSGYETNSTAHNDSLLIVKIPSARRNGPRKRLSKALSSAHRNMKKLRTENERLKRKIKTTQRKMQRLKEKQSCLTPKSKTDKMMQRLRFKKTNKYTQQVRRQLLTSFVVADEIANNVKVASPRKKKSIYGAVVGQLVLKYRCISSLSEATKLNRNMIKRVIEKGVMNIKNRKRTQMKYKESVVNFLEREDNSRMNPGKKDAIKCDEGKVQTRILTDYLDNLYRKYMSENPEATLSLATFKRIRPKYILTSQHLSRATCLCTKHQNFSFKLKMLKNVGLTTTCNAEEFVRQKMNIDCTKLPETVTFSTWKRVTLNDGKKKMKIIQEEMNREELTKLWDKESVDFTEHVKRLQKQYSEIRNLKQDLPANEVIIHMDFAENYACKTAEDIQSVYWNQTSVTLHPMVLYCKEKEKETQILKHKSFVAVSDCLTHASLTVLAILEDFYGLGIPELQNVKHVHYWTDSPTSQYRNRFIFETIFNHPVIFGFPATWNYFEAGHDKGPCDGVGGTAKRMADGSVNAHKATIQDAEDFFQWSKSSSGVKNIEFFFVTKEHCETKAEEVKQCQLKPVKGTMTLHACKSKNTILYIANTSCYCKDCLKGDVCEHWSKGAEIRDNDNLVQEQDDTVERTETENISEKYTENDYVAAVYIGKWYVGKILKIDNDDNEAEISFMNRRKNLFQWPTAEDIIWVSNDDILCKIKEPTASGKSARMFKLESEDLDTIEELYSRMSK